MSIILIINIYITINPILILGVGKLVQTLTLTCKTGGIGFMVFFPCTYKTLDIIP
jgi:hypothetical protein